MLNEKENYEILEQMAFDEQMALFGVGNIKEVQSTFTLKPLEKIEDLIYGISIGIKISDPILELIQDKPTLLYKFHYRIANTRLDQVAIKIANYIEKQGYRAMQIPASQILYWKPKMVGHLSHKKIAYFAGHGWIGRNNLMVNPEYGSRIRYTSILTDFPLKADEPIEGDCGDCYDCMEVCPANAIHESKDDFDLESCYQQLEYFRRKTWQGRMGVHICGICVRACRGKR